MGTPRKPTLRRGCARAAGAATLPRVASAALAAAHTVGRSHLHTLRAGPVLLTVPAARLSVQAAWQPRSFAARRRPRLQTGYPALPHRRLALLSSLGAHCAEKTGQEGANSCVLDGTLLHLTALPRAAAWQRMLGSEHIYINCFFKNFTCRIKAFL